MNDQSLLNLIIAPEVEDAIIDWLLLCDRVSGFTSMPVSGDGSSIHSPSTVKQITGKQITGWQRQVLIQSCLPPKDGEQVIKALYRDFAGSGMRYWLSPLQAAGHLD